MKHFAIPKSATGLKEVSPSQLDLRPDSAIIADLKSHRPLTSEKNVWAFWDKGFDAMYPMYKRTVINWVKKLGPSWTVRVLDLVQDSPNNVYNFVDEDWFPDCFNNRTMDGRHAAQHGSDLVRLTLLYEHGGVWMDVGNMLHTHLDDLFWNHLTAPDTPYEMAVWIITGQIRKKWGSFGNYMLAARKKCEFIKNWHLGFKALWEGRTNVDGFWEIPLMRDIGLAEGMRDWNDDAGTHLMSDYVSQMLIGDRTKLLLDVETGWNGLDFWNNKVFMVEGIYNGILGALVTDLDGERQADLFLTPLNDPDPRRREAAEKFVVRMLEHSHMYKVYHNSGDGVPALGDLIKKKEYLDACDRPGTFGEMYRYGTVYWKQRGRLRGWSRRIPEKR